MLYAQTQCRSRFIHLFPYTFAHVETCTHTHTNTHAHRRVAVLTLTVALNGYIRVEHTAVRRERENTREGDWK